jgi:hypothetical protein
MSDDRSSGSNAGVVIIVALLVLAVPCCGGVALLGLGVFSYRAAARPVPPPADVQVLEPANMPEVGPTMEVIAPPEKAVPQTPPLEVAPEPAPQGAAK